MQPIGGCRVLYGKGTKCKNFAVLCHYIHFLVFPEMAEGGGELQPHSHPTKSATDKYTQITI